MSGNFDPAALGFSLQIDLGAGRVCTMQTFLPNFCSAIELNRMLDKMTAAGDRQRAHYRIEELEREIAREEKAQEQHKEDLARLDREHEAKQAARDAQIEKLRTALDNFEAARRDAHVESGRRGEFQLRGTDKQSADRATSEITKAVAERDQAEVERNVAHQNSLVTIKRQDEILARMREEVERCKATVAAGLADTA